MKTRLVLLVGLGCAAAVSPFAATKQTLLMNRLGPSQMVLYIANADGSGERPLLGSSGFDYNASFSPDGNWVVFTSERAGSGQADLYRVRPDGSGLERLTDDPDVDDQAAISSDGSHVAFISARAAERSETLMRFSSCSGARCLGSGSRVPRFTVLRWFKDVVNLPMKPYADELEHRNLST